MEIVVAKKQKKKPKQINPVAKNMNKFNKPATMKDKKNDYKRKAKHKKADSQNGSAFLIRQNIDAGVDISIHKS